MRVIHWFRRDLRLTDNPALTWAAENADELYLVYIHAPEDETPWAPGAAACWWLEQSLQALRSDLQARRQTLILREGSAQRSLPALIEELQADAVSWNRLYEPATIKRDRTLKTRLREQGLTVHSANSHLLLEPRTVSTGQDQPYRVFTPFWKQARTQIDLRAIQPPPDLPSPNRDVPSRSVQDLALTPDHPWTEKLARHWQPGEAGALAQLQHFQAEAVADYDVMRDRPDQAGTSRLSPHLHWGEIGPHQILAEHGPEKLDDRYATELGWREFAHHVLFHFPETPLEPLNHKYTGFPWREGVQAQPDLKRWQQGRTGIALVDAGMRELWETGWMHNRVRMIVASLLTKNLGVHWREGARWFWDTLVDADLASNTMGWQWAAGSGADAAPYFRIFNPDTQAEKFDPSGAYRARWLGDAAGIQPMVDLKRSRAAALERHAAHRGDTN